MVLYFENNIPLKKNNKKYFVLLKNKKKITKNSVIVFKYVKNMKIAIFLNLWWNLILQFSKIYFLISVYYKKISFTVFGLALCSQFDTATRTAPILVERCTRVLEERAFTDTTLDLYKIYYSSPPNEQILELREKLNEGNYFCPFKI